jgi:hypothetical protein
VDEAVNSVMSTSGLSFSEQTPTDIGGASGARFEISLDEPGSATLHGMSNGLDQIGILQGDRVLAWFLDVAGQPVGFFAVAHETGPFLDEAQTLIESIIWKDLR